MSPDRDRTQLLLALVATTLVGFVALTHRQIPAMALAVGVFAAVTAILKF